MRQSTHVYAPFTEEQIESLNGYQASGVMHPFTCDGPRMDAAHKAYTEAHGGDYGQLVATAAGWHCPVCDYKQFWAHAFMADGSWKQAAGPDVFYCGGRNGGKTALLEVLQRQSRQEAQPEGAAQPRQRRYVFAHTRTQFDFYREAFRDRNPEAYVFYMSSIDNLRGIPADPHSAIVLLPEFEHNPHHRHFEHNYLDALVERGHRLERLTEAQYDAFVAGKEVCVDLSAV